MPRRVNPGSRGATTFAGDFWVRIDFGQGWRTDPIALMRIPNTNRYVNKLEWFGNGVTPLLVRKPEGWYFGGLIPVKVEFYADYRRQTKTVIPDPTAPQEQEAS